MKARGLGKVGRGLGQAESSDSPTHRDVAWLGDCDQGCLALADLLGWKVRSLPRPTRSLSPNPCPTGPVIP